MEKTIKGIIIDELLNNKPVQGGINVSEPEEGRFLVVSQMTDLRMILDITINDPISGKGYISVLPATDSEEDIKNLEKNNQSVLGILRNVSNTLTRNGYYCTDLFKVQSEQILEYVPRDSVKVISDLDGIYSNLKEWFYDLGVDMLKEYPRIMIVGYEGYIFLAKKPNLDLVKTLDKESLSLAVSLRNRHINRAYLILYGGRFELWYDKD